MTTDTGGPPPTNTAATAGYRAGLDSTTSEPPGPLSLRPGDHPDAVLIAASLAASGWPVLALWPGSKRPTHGGSTTDNHADRWLSSVAAVVGAAESTADTWTGRVGCQYAAMTGQPSESLDGLALVGLDVDGDAETLAALLDEAGPDAVEWAAETLRVQRCADRLHLWGTVPADECPPTGDVAPGLEWRGSTGYLLLPGSRHPDGPLYAVTGGQYEFTHGGQPEGAVYVGLTEPDASDPLGLAAWVHPLPLPDSLLAVIRRRLARGSGDGAPVRAGLTTEEARALIGSPSFNLGLTIPDRERTTGAAYARVLDALRSAGRVSRVRGSDVLAHCPGPTHRNGDRDPSLSVTGVTGRALLHCFTGCQTADVLDALGLGLSDLYDDENGDHSVTLHAVDGTPDDESPTVIELGPESATERRARLAGLIDRARDGEYARAVGRTEARDLWESDLHSLAESDPAAVLASAERRFHLFDRDAVVSLPDPLDLVTGVLPPLGEIGELSGSRGLGKSLTALDLSAHVAADPDKVPDGAADLWAGVRRVNIHGPVVYVAREGWQGFGKRVRAWERFGWPGAGVSGLRGERRLSGVTFTPSGVDLRKPDDAYALGMLSKARGAVLVVLDSAQGTGLGAEDTADTARFNAGVRIVRDVSGAALLVLHNAGWDESRGRGSTLLPDIAGSVVHLTGDPKGLRVLRDQKFRDGTAGDALGFTFHKIVVGTDANGREVTSGVLVPADLPAEALAEVNELRGRCLRALDASPGASAEDVRRVLDLDTKDKASRLLKALESAGAVENLGAKNRGAWHLSADGRKSLVADDGGNE